MSTTIDRQSPPAYLSRLTDPLTRLRRTIRAYTLAEGIALIVTFAGCWFWLTFLCDWALFFKLLGIDYVRDGSTIARNILRGVFLIPLIWGLGSILLFRIMNRLFT